MSEGSKEIVRVNFSSATTPSARGVEAGSIPAEIPLQLPSNIIAAADKVKGARMLLSRMSLPLSRIPDMTVSNISILSPITVGLNEHGVAFLPAAVEMDGHLAVYRSYYGSVTTRDFVRLEVDTPPMNDQVMNNLRASNLFEIPRIEAYLRAFSRALTRMVSEAWGPAFTEEPPPTYKLHSEESNTLSLDVIPSSMRILRPEGQVPTGNLALKLFDDGDSVANSTNGGLVFATEAVALTLHTLPWQRIKNEAVIGETREGYRPFNTTDEYIYYLNSRLANIRYGTGIPCVYYEGSGITAQHYKVTLYPLVYNFPTSEVTSIADEKTIIVTLNGMNFSGQVFPVNFSEGTATYAQVTSVPILEVIYPLISKPSELSTNMILVKDIFEAAGPVRLEPSSLKERNILVKTWWVTRTGRMREILMPAHSVLTLQITFEFIF